MSEFEALKLAYQGDKDPPSLIKKEIDSPVHTSQKDIDEVLTTLADSLASPFLAECAQPVTVMILDILLLVVLY